MFKEGFCFSVAVTVAVKLLSVVRSLSQVGLYSWWKVFVTMFLTRYFGRRFLAVAYTRSESTAAAAAASTVQTAENPVEDEPVGYGWKLSELQTKSWDDLQKLWDVVLKEKNMLTTQGQKLRAQKMEFPDAKRLAKARQSLSHIKLVMTRRGVNEPDKKKSLEMMRIINAM